MICSLLVHIAAIHIGFSQHYRSMVPGAGLDCEVTDSISLAIGSYRNSVGDRSNYLLAAKDFQVSSSVKAGFFIGGVDGYYWRNRGKLDYFGGLRSSVKLTDSTSLQIQFIPGQQYTRQGVICIGFSHSFGNIGETNK